MDDLRMKLAKFRTTCSTVVPYLMKSIYGLIAVERPGIGTMAVDQYARLYYDPAYVERVSIETGRWTILHETLHVVLGHCDIAKRVLGDKPTPAMCEAYNWAADIVVNQMLATWGQDAPEGIITYQRCKLPPKLTVTEYYALLMQQKQQEEQEQGDEQDDDTPDMEPGDDDTNEEDDDDSQQQGDDDRDGDSEEDEPGDEEGDDAAESGDGSDSEDGEEDASGGGEDEDDSEDGEADGEGGESGDGEEGGDQSGDGGDADGEVTDQEGAGGSSADGQPRSYELPPDAAHRDREYGMASELLDAIEEQESKSPGSVPAALVAACGLKMRPTTVDPWEQLKNTFARATASPLGAPDYTLMRPSRRQQKDGPILRGIKRHLPDCVVLLDTSGSMQLYGQSEIKVKALAVIAQGAKKLRSVTVRCGDTDLANKQVVRAVGQMRIEGGGGTDMGRLVEEIDREDRPTCIVVITDLETDWCERKPRARVIIVGVKALSATYPVPAWATYVDCSKGGA